MDVGARLVAVSSLAFCIASGMPACAVPASLDNKIESVEVDGTAFRVSLAGGTVLEGRELEGATISVALLADVEPQRILLARITTDRADPQGEVLLYDMKLVDPETGIAALRSRCQGRTLGVPAAGPVGSQRSAYQRRRLHADLCGRCPRQMCALRL